VALNNYSTSAATYNAARKLSLEGLDDWRRAIEPYVAQVPGGLPILDLGSGTGQFAEAFATWFEPSIVGVEPSPEMRQQAEARRTSSRIQYIEGSASSIPLPDASCGLAWLSTVIHHFPSLPDAARELRRVLAPGCYALIRSAFPGRHEGITLFTYFPEGTRVLERFPTVDATRKAFESAGFVFDALRPVPQVSVASLTEFRERVSHRNTDTILRGLTDEEHAAGLARLDEAIDAGAGGPLVDRLDLLVFRLPVDNAPP
jgi:ubiquinone/menaquinone biosynthesis C-methylase UbiE